MVDASRTRKHSEAGYGWPVDRGAWTAKTVKRPRQQPAHPQYANYWAPLTRKRHIPPHSAQPQHTNYWAPRTRERHQQEHRPQQPTERSNPTQHAKGRTGDCPGPRKGATTRRNVTQGGGRLTASLNLRRNARLHVPGAGAGEVRGARGPVGVGGSAVPQDGPGLRQGPPHSVDGVPHDGYAPMPPRGAPACGGTPFAVASECAPVRSEAVLFGVRQGVGARCPESCPARSPPPPRGGCIGMHLVNGTGNSPSPGRLTPGVVKQDKSSGGAEGQNEQR